MARKTKTAGRIIGTLLGVLLLVGVVGFLAVFSGGFKKGVQNFYLRQGSRVITTGQTGLELRSDKSVKFEPRYSLEPGKLPEYSVKIIPNRKDSIPLDFFVADEVHSFQAEEDLTEGFRIEQGTNFFKITAPETLLDVLQSVYPEQSVTLDESRLTEDYDLFCLVVTTRDKSEVKAYFSIVNAVTGIELEPGEVVL